MSAHKNYNNIEIKYANEENFYDLYLCANEFLDFIDNFKEKFFNKEYFILSAYFNNVLAGLLIAEDKTQKINSLKEIVPHMNLHLLYVNPKFRNKNIGKILLNYFILIQKNNDIASIYVELPQKYRDGIKFFLENNFKIINRKIDKIVLELALWKDYGIRECQIIGENFNDLF